MTARGGRKKKKKKRKRFYGDLWMWRLFFPVLSQAFALIIVLTEGRESCCSFSLSHPDAPTQGSVRVDEEKKAIRNSAFGWLFRTLSCVNIIILYTRHRIPPSTILLSLLMIVPDECYQHTDTPPPHAFKSFAS